MARRNFIRSTSRMLAHTTVARLGVASPSRKRLFRSLTARSKRRFIRFGILTANIAVLVAVLGFMLKAPSATNAVNQSSTKLTAPTTVTNPLDQLSSADIAVYASQAVGLPETTAVTNQADTVNAELAVTPVDNTVVAKPQVVATALKSRQDIQHYTTKLNDTVSALAAKFNVTSDSIRASNGLTSNNLAAGLTLSIPPIDGIVYTVKAGDTPDSLASKFGANKDQIIAFNDAEISGLQPNEQIVIPNGILPAVAAASTSLFGGGYGTGFAFGNTPIYGYNGYDYGFCTWYVASKISIPSNWGNASSWSYYAARSGWAVSPLPVVGAIAQTPYAAAGEGHVAVVEAVSPDGTMIKYSDMNGLAGYGRVGHSVWTPSSHFPNYIYR